MSYSISDLESAMKQNHAVRQSVVKHFITLAASMLAVLAAFHSGNTDCNFVLSVSFVATILLLLLCLVCGSILLYYDMVAARKLYEQVRSEWQPKPTATSATTKSALAFYDPPRLFYICSKVFYPLLLLAVLLLSSYAVLKEFL